MKDALAAIVARHKPEEGEDEREDFRDYHSDAANDLFARGEWRNKFRVGDEIAYVKSKGHSKDNLAGPDVVNAFVALMDARKEELTKLLDEQPDKDAVVPAACQASRHRGEAKAFQPNQRCAIRWEEGKPVGRKTHAQGGGEIVSGDFLFNDDMAQEIVSSATPEQLKGDLAKLAAESYRLYCRDCQTEANRESKPGEKIIFRTMAWIKHALELKTGRVAGLTEARSFEAGARRRRPYPRAVRGARAGRDSDRRPQARHLESSRQTGVHPGYRRWRLWECDLFLRVPSYVRTYLKMDYLIVVMICG